MYIIDHAQQLQYIKDMTQLRRDLEQCVVYYHHPHTNQMWKSFFPAANEEGLGPKLLRHEPLPDELSEHIRICLAEDVPENAIGLGIEFSGAPDKWPEIFGILEKNRPDYLSGQLRLFIKHLEIDKYQEKVKQNNGIEEQLLTEEDFKKLIRRSRKLKLKSLFT